MFRVAGNQGMANKRRSREELKEVGALVERLREFVRLNYMAAAEQIANPNRFLSLGLSFYERVPAPTQIRTPEGCKTLNKKSATIK